MILRDQLYMLLRGSQNIGHDEKQVILSQLGQNRILRDTLCEVLNEMSTGKHVENQQCLQTLADLIKAALTSKSHYLN